MTNQEAITILENLKSAGKCFFSQRLAIDLAIKALEESPIDDLSEYSDKLWQKAYERGKAEARPTNKELLKELKNCRDELCLKCGRYRESYLGACDDCRYNFEHMKKWEEANNETN